MKKNILLSVVLILITTISDAQPIAKAKILVLAEAGGHHIRFTEAMRPWLVKLAQDNSFKIDFITNTTQITEEFLKSYQLFIQLDYPPYGWEPKAASAFQNYIEKGDGGWVGLHHATLLGEFDGFPMWNWFSDFMGHITYKNYIPTFVAGKVVIEDKHHPVTDGVPLSFIIEKEEWYTYNQSPRQNVQVLANVDESSYVPDSDIKMGDHPVVWSNPNYKARNIYIFMGHSPDLLRNNSYTTLLTNAIFWTLHSTQTKN